MFQSLINGVDIIDWTVVAMLWFMIVFSAVLVYVLAKGKSLEGDARHLPLDELESEPTQGGSP